MLHEYKIQIETEEADRGYHPIHIWVFTYGDSVPIAEYGGKSLSRGLALASKAIQSEEEANPL